MTATTGPGRAGEVQRPAWAAQVLAALADAGAYGHTPKGGAEQRLTRGEQLMLDGIAFRVRGRLGELTSRGGDMGDMGDELLRTGMEQIASPATEESPRRPASPNRNIRLAFLSATMAAVLLGVVTVTEAAWGRYMSAALFGLMGAAYVVLAGIARRSISTRETKATGEAGDR